MKKYLFSVCLTVASASLFAASIEIAPVANGTANVNLNRVATIDTGDSVIFDLSKATHAGSSVYFPVSISSDDTIHSLDFSFKYDHNELSYDSIHNLTAYIQPLSYYSPVDSTVRFTSFSIQPYAKGVTLVTVHFTMLGSQLDSADLNSLVAYLNGNTCSHQLINPFPSGIKEFSESGLVKIYPNPSRSRVTIEVPEKASVQILDDAGRSVYFEKEVAAHTKHDLSLTGMSAGIYLVRVFNERFSAVEKMVIEK